MSERPNISSPVPSMSTLRSFLVEDTHGSASIEFVIVFPLFMLLFLVTFEAGWFMTREMMFSRAVDIASRELRLGLRPGITHDQFKDSICARTIVFPNCDDDLVVELVVFDATAAYPDNEPNCADRSDRTIAPKIEFIPDGAEDDQEEIMFIRACMAMDLMFPSAGLGSLKSQDGLGGIYLQAYSAYVNEPGR